MSEDFKRIMDVSKRVTCFTSRSTRAALSPKTDSWRKAVLHEEREGGLGRLPSLAFWFLELNNEG